jgi:hypothetical protein
MDKICKPTLRQFKLKPSTNFSLTPKLLGVAMRAVNAISQ